MSFLDKYGLKPKKIKINLDGEEHEFYAKQISFNLAVALAQQFNEVARQLAIVKYCLCEEDGSMVFPEDIALEVIGDKLPYEVISIVATKIAKMSGPKERIEDVKKKHGN
ncbi:hypothetical protein ACLHZ0_21580 [Aeromonas salmonicida]|uniref:hypothetical protein n=1 Tax=Aeromonas salmonicida TaxID=645 RepID=UPI003D0952EF